MNADPLTGAYHGAAQAWADDASLAYVPLARHLVANLDEHLPGARALDAGAGTGAVGDLLRALGADVLSVDLEPDMLRFHLPHRGRVVAGDVSRLPLRSGWFDVVAAAFVLNHVADHAACLRELARVTRPGGVVLASVFDNDRSPVKEAIDECLHDFGWAPPPWYAAVRERAEATGTVELLTAHARAAGLARAEVRRAVVDVGLDSPDLVVRYRFAMAHTHGYVLALPDDDRVALARAAEAAVAKLGGGFRPEVLELVAPVG